MNKQYRPYTSEHQNILFCPDGRNPELSFSQISSLSSSGEDSPLLPDLPPGASSNIIMTTVISLLESVFAKILTPVFQKYCQPQGLTEIDNLFAQFKKSLLSNDGALAL